MDPEAVREMAMQLREQYPDDDDFAAAMGRLEALLAQESAPEETT